MKRHSIFVILLLFIVIQCGSDTAQVLRNIPRSERKNLMVLNIKNASPKAKAEEFMPWEFGIASMLMTDLESIGLFNIISRERLKDVVSAQELQLSGLVDPAKAVRIGKLAAAKYLLAGSFMEMNGTLRIESQVFSVETGEQLGAASVAGKTDRFFELEKELVIKVTAYLDAMLTAAESSVIRKKVETKSVEASLNNYAGEIAMLTAEELKEKGDKEKAKQVLNQAKDDFKEALKYDPNYERAKQNLAKIAMSIPVTL
jgi:TolB-like protein